MQRPMLKDTFSQESKVSREIDLLFLRIFGRFQVMLLISNQVRVTTLEQTDYLWKNEIESNIEYNSTSLGADIWDSICRWNQDIVMVKFWLNIYTQANASRMKYFITPIDAWNENMTKLFPLIQIFENCGGIDTVSVLLQCKLQNEIEHRKQDVKNQKEDIRKIVEKYKKNIHAKDEQILQEQILLSSEKTKNQFDISNLTLDFSQRQNRSNTEIGTLNATITRLKTKMQKNDDSQEKLVKKESECVNLQDEITNNEAVIKEKEDQIIAFGDIKLKLVEKESECAGFKEQIINNEALIKEKDENIIAFGDIKLKLVEKESECAGFKEQIINNEALIKEKDENIITFGDIKQMLVEKELECANFKDQLINNEALIKENEQKIHTFDDIRKQLVQKESECADLQNQIILNDNLIRHNGDNLQTIENLTRDLEAQGKKFTELEDQIVFNNSVEYNGDAKEIETLKDQVELSERDLKKSEKRNETQQKIINKLKIEATQAASDQNYKQLEKSREYLEDINEKNKVDIKRMGLEIKIMWQQLRKAESMGYKILSPAGIKRQIQEDEEEKIKKKAEAGPAKSGWFSNKIGPRPYII